MNALQITIPSIFAVAAVVMCFFRRLPSCMAAYAALVSAGILDVLHLQFSQYLLWGFIAVVDTVNVYATRMEAPRTMQLYTVVGGLVGCVLGTLGGTFAAILCASALGEILGLIAFSRTPQGRMTGVPVTHRLSMWAGPACTAWFTFMMVATVLISFMAVS